MSKDVKALGEFVILISKAESAGTELKSESGLFLGNREVGEIPDVCVVHSIGPRVPDGYVKVGDVVPTPHGVAKNVLNPRVVNHEGNPKDFIEKYLSLHYTHLTSVYFDQ